MKKTIAVIIFLFLSTAAQAQIIKSIGIKIGGTASSQEWEYSPASSSGRLDPDTKTGLNVGAFAELFRLPLFSLVAEINYVEKGVQQEIPITTPGGPMGTGETIKWKLGLNYMNFSLLGKVRLDGIICTPYLIAGPKVDLRVSTSNTYNDSFYNGFNKTSFGFKAGAGTEIKLFGINFLAEVLYDADFGNLYESNLLKITSSAIDFRAGAFINF